MRQAHLRSSDSCCLLYISGQPVTAGYPHCGGTGLPGLQLSGSSAFRAGVMLGKLC